MCGEVQMSPIIWLHTLVSIIAFNKSLQCVHNGLVKVFAGRTLIPCISTVPSFRTHTVIPAGRMAAQRAVAGAALPKDLLGLNLLGESSLLLILLPPLRPY